LQQLESFLQRHVAHAHYRDVATFFTGLLVNHFYSRPTDKPWIELWELFEDQVDAFAMTGEGEELMQIIESVDVATRRVLPEYSELKGPLNIEEVNILGSSSIALVIRLP
jgi:hypothetical protein